MSNAILAAEPLKPTPSKTGSVVPAWPGHQPKEMGSAALFATPRCPTKPQVNSPTQQAAKAASTSWATM